jgi:hypothetical protein
MRWLHLILVGLGSACLQSCAPQVIASNERGGIISHVNGASQADAFALADSHCQKYGRVAQVTGMDIVYNRLMFACVAP